MVVKSFHLIVSEFLSAVSTGALAASIQMTSRGEVLRKEIHILTVSEDEILVETTCILGIGQSVGLLIHGPAEAIASLLGEDPFINSVTTTIDAKVTVRSLERTVGSEYCRVALSMPRDFRIAR